RVAAAGTGVVPLHDDRAARAIAGNRTGRVVSEHLPEIRAPRSHRRVRERAAGGRIGVEGDVEGAAFGTIAIRTHSIDDRMGLDDRQPSLERTLVLPERR